MHIRVIGIVLAAFVFFAAPFNAISANAQDSFVFTAIPDQDETRLRTRFEKVARYLSETLEIDVQYVPVKSYAAAVTAFRNDQVQLAWFGGLSGVQARRAVEGSEALAQGAEDQEFVTYFIAHASTGLTESPDFPKSIAGKTFTFGSKGSTSGRLMPEFHVRNHFGKSPDDVFSRVGFSGDHSRTIALVQSGAFEVGAVNFAVWENELRDGRIDPEKVRIIWRTPTYPDYQWSIRGDVNRKFGPEFVERVRTALLAIDDPELLKAFPRSRFIPATNEDYTPILRVGKDIGLID
ncbi:MAG: putative selenate ABC transporter substrate-binding protein [Rhodospirillaceae bacterium]|jgi:phosphonate transport system substrate-binding protein|nr:putative selenate ABC transporter substrate-binding protein [Rhodospirillaceae bacterium]MBT5943754.1 putative selenate ABC transporter substrate-binding protein [Rhodospirillaceae bacterium]MBT6405308.1 putative selenate ABC transporter substrate-binding protein [Rhodospirillaceae bacterium]MBT6537824.1 putative selenate ABC transporter substrate-binding protein [Rhodospirillaceae bacterium]MBT7362576.1 putative selenate ABC transporter substrate-binding protein [Rhodospirillaceae bacterium